MSDIRDLGNVVTEKLKEGALLSDLKHILTNYSNTDWNKYILFNQEKYTKTVVFQNNLIDIAIICWNTGQQSGIHDHPDGGCLLKLLSGNLQEELYTKELQLLQVNNLNFGDIAYIQGKNGLHNIGNVCDNPAISLHIYSPPNYKPLFY